VQGERVFGGEPADGAGQVDAIEQVFFAAVAFHADQDPVLSGPAGQGVAEGGEQDVVDLGAVGRGDLVQQRIGLGGT
jgi:hypothetical protein